MIYAFTEVDKISAPSFERWLRALPEFRRRQAQSYRFKADALLSVCSFLLLCIALGFVPTDFKVNEYGKPYIEGGPHFNISHSANCVAAVASPSPAGVDCQSLAPFKEAVMRRVFTADEIYDIINSKDPQRLFFTYWTLKESYVKALGVGMSFPFRQVSFKITDGRPVCSDESFEFSSYSLGAIQLSGCGRQSFGLKRLGLEEFIVHADRILEAGYAGGA